jgi:hypothetical protein
VSNRVAPIAAADTRMSASQKTSEPGVVPHDLAARESVHDPWHWRHGGAPDILAAWTGGSAGSNGGSLRAT